jgi:hypothetical protein
VLEEALAEAVVEDADLPAAIEVIQDVQEMQVARRLLRKRLAKVTRAQQAA